MEFKREFIKDRVVLGIVSESSGDYVLPDYNGDVKKILFVEAKAVPAGKFQSADSVQFSGSVVYSVVYLDSENNVTHCEFDTDYDICVKCNEERYRDADISTSVENYQLRPSGPRKFTAKAMLDSTAHVLETEEICTAGSAFTDREPEVLSKEVKVRRYVVSCSESREYAEEMEHIDGVIADETEILYTGAEYKILSSELVGGRGEHKGEIVATALVKCEDEIPHLVTKVIPFEESFEFDGENSTEGLEVLGVDSELIIDSVRCTVTGVEDGVSVTVSVITEGKMYALGNTEASLIKDCYLEDVGCDNEESMLDYSEVVSFEKHMFDVKESVDRHAALCENARNILLSDSTVRVNEVKLTDECVTVGGEIRFSGIACEISEENEPIYTPAKISVPFCENVKFDCQIPDGSKILCTSRTMDSSLLLDASSVISECRVELALSVHKDRRENYVSTSSMNDIKYETDDTVVCVCYPEDGETLFDIAKRYHKSQISIAGINSLSESVFADKGASVVSLGVDRLIIR